MFCFFLNVHRVDFILHDKNCGSSYPFFRWHVKMAVFCVKRTCNIRNECVYFFKLLLTKCLVIDLGFDGGSPQIFLVVSRDR